MFQSLIGIIDNWNGGIKGFLILFIFLFQSLIGIIDNWNSDIWEKSLPAMFQSLIGIIDNWNPTYRA